MPKQTQIEKHRIHQTRENYLQPEVLAAAGEVILRAARVSDAAAVIIEQADLDLAQD